MFTSFNLKLNPANDFKDYYDGGKIMYNNGPVDKGGEYVRSMVE